MVKQLKNGGTTPKKVPFGPGLTIDIVETNYRWREQVLMWVSESVPLWVNRLILASSSRY